MRSTTTLKFLAAAYALGLIWTLALVGGAVVLMPPMTELYESLGIGSTAIRVGATMSLDVIAATLIAIAAAVVIRAAADRRPATRRGHRAPEAATHRI
jgi:hypothetical protein